MKYITIEEDKIKQLIESLKFRENACWNMTKVFFENKDAHGIHDMGVELQALQRAILELNKINEK